MFIKSVEPLEDNKLLIDFTTGERKIYDIKPLYSLPIFSELKNKSLFKSFRIGKYYIEWPNGADLTADTLFIEGKPVI
jgi:hypothetical protein